MENLRSTCSHTKVCYFNKQGRRLGNLLHFMRCLEVPSLFRCTCGSLNGRVGTLGNSILIWEIMCGVPVTSHLFRLVLAVTLRILLTGQLQWQNNFFSRIM